MFPLLQFASSDGRRVYFRIWRRTRWQKDKRMAIWKVEHGDLFQLWIQSSEKPFTECKKIRKTLVLSKLSGYKDACYIVATDSTLYTIWTPLQSNPLSVSISAPLFSEFAFQVCNWQRVMAGYQSNGIRRLETRTGHIILITFCSWIPQYLSWVTRPVFEKLWYRKWDLEHGTTRTRRGRKENGSTSGEKKTGAILTRGYLRVFGPW